LFVDASSGSAGKTGMNRALFFLFLSTSIPLSLAAAQISPGELIAGHARWEGVENCTACHTVGKSLSNDRCLSCHAEIDSRVKAKEGFHATVSAKLCEECHKEHHGRKFQIIRFDTTAFDHATVGFTLDGKHRTIGCRQCHTKKTLAAEDILTLSDGRKNRTYLGLSPRCSTCHEDKHRGQFEGKECSACHDTEKWKPAPKFSHDQSSYPLTGKHKSVDCQRCHKPGTDEFKTVRYVHMEFASCRSCHADPHKGKFKQECASCHSTEDFHTVTKKVFDHDTTRFPLKGKHALMKCEGCHEKNNNKKNASGELGFHITKFQRCADCHADAHAGQFANRIDGGRCESCHTEDDFLRVTYSVADHRKARFLLTGAHVAVPCAACHAAQKVNAKSTRQFIWEKSPQCTTCHEDIHKGQFEKKMPKGCETCHSVESWNSLLFSHEQTRFPLKGKHAAVACEKCHTRPNNSATLPVQYTGVGLECIACHKDEHEGQFAKRGTTDCSPCHNAEAWKSLVFNHNRQSRYELTGKHLAVACEKCHPKVEMNERKVVRYKPLGMECADCHAGKM